MGGRLLELPDKCLADEGVVIANLFNLFVEGEKNTFEQYNTNSQAAKMTKPSAQKLFPTQIQQTRLQNNTKHPSKREAGQQHTPQMSSHVCTDFINEAVITPRLQFADTAQRRLPRANTTRAAAGAPERSETLQQLTVSAEGDQFEQQQQQQRRWQRRQ